MASRELSPVGGSGLSSSDGFSGGLHHPLRRRQSDTTTDTSSSQSESQHSGGALRHSPESRPNAQFSADATNDSFGQPLGNHTMFASTRPFSNPQSPNDVEQFLSEPPVSNQTFTPSSLNRNADMFHVSANSSFVSIPKTESTTVDVSSNTSSHPMNMVPPIVVRPQRPASSASSAVTPLSATVHHDPNSTSDQAIAQPSGAIAAAQSSPLMASSKPPMPTLLRSTSYSSKPPPFSAKGPSLSEKAPSTLVATASSHGNTSNTGFAGVHSPLRQTSTGLYPSTAATNVSAAGPAAKAAAAASPRPASPSMNVACTGSNPSLNSHGSESTSLEPLSDGGVAALADYSPLLRNSLTPNFATQPRPGDRHGYTTVPSASPITSPTQQREGGLPYSRSERELRHLFGDRGNVTNTPFPSGVGATSALQYSVDSSNGMGRRSPSRQSGAALSTGTRQRGVVRATESSGLAGTHTSSRRSPPSSGWGGGGSSGVIQPGWLSAVERAKSGRVNEDFSLYDPVLPYDQSRLGLLTRQAGQQGTLTAGKLRAWEAQHAGSGAVRGGERGGLQPLVAYSVAGGRVGSPMPRTGGATPTRMPILTAQEEALQATARYNRALSEQGGGRRSGHIRSIANGGSVSAYGSGRHAVTAIPSSLRGSAGSGGVITASETVTNSGNVGGVNNTFMSRSEQGGIPGASHGGLGAKFNTAEHKLANLFQLRSASNSSGLQAKETSAGELVSTSFGSGNGSTTTNAVLRPADELKATTPRNTGTQSSCGAGGGGGGGGDGGGGGGGSGGSRRDSNDNGPAHKRRSKRGDLGKPVPTESKEVKQQMDTEGDEDERDERNFRMRSINALHAIPWDQRRQLPMTGFGTRFFALLSTPRFWEKLDWTVRGSLLTVLPTMVLALEPATTNRFPMASSLAFNAFWITMPTFGSGLRELIIALKGFSFGLIFLIIVVATQPGPDWLLLLLLFLFTLFSSFVAEETKKTTAYVLASTIMQYLTDHKGTNFTYVGQYYEGLLIALAFGTAAFLVPFIRWSSDIARHYIKAMANSLSIDLQGTLSSFWVRTPLERELNVMRLRQLRATAEKCIGKIETALDESGYEPHTGAYMMCMTNRFNFCKSIHNILGSLSHVIELIADNPSCVDTPMCNAFGEQIGDDLAIISSAMDSMVLKICDFERIVTPQEIQFFREARERFQEAVSRVREDVILTNENYETDESDILLGFFMFSVDEICEVISQFEETAHPPNTLVNALMFPIRDIKSVIFAFKNLTLTVVRRRTIPRRLKEAIKLAVCMVLPCIFQVYALGNDSVSPMAGASVIALIYNPTGSESFHYASGRLLGTVLGSMASLLSVQIANGRRWVLYLFIILLSFIGAYVQAAPGFYALGNAIVCSTISVCTQYTNQNAAMVRIQQNCFAILMYFAVVCILWPMRARTKVKMSLDFALRCTRESITRMLRNLDMPYDPSEVTADVSALLMEMNKKVRTQVRFIPGAVEEPTMGSVEYPEDAWKRIVEAERKLWLAVSMMRFAYHTFMSSRADATTELSVHWVVLHRISPHARDLSDLIYAAIDLYLLSLNNTTVVPTSHLTRLRVGMVEAHKAIVDTYIRTILRKVAGEDSDDDDVDNDEDNSFHSSYIEDEDHYDPSDYGGYQPPPTTTHARAFPSDDEGRANNNSSSTHHSNGASTSGAPKSTSGKTERKETTASTATVATAAATAVATAAATAAALTAASHNSDDNAGTTEQKKGDTRHKHTAHRCEGSAASSSSSSAASSSHKGDDNDDGEQQQQKKKGKKMGYLGYDLTKEEAAALRAFVANRVVNNNTFGMKKSMVGNTTFNGRSMAGAMSAAAAAATAVLNGGAGRAPMAGSPPQVNNDARLMAMRGGDDDLAATLRKKHNVMVKKNREDINADKNTNEDDTHNNDSINHKTSADKPKTRGEPQVENLANLNLTNGSFFKNHSFLKNTSFLGSLFGKKPKETQEQDAEEMCGAEVSSSTSAASKSGKKGKKTEAGEKPRRASSAVAHKRRWEREDDTAGERSTPSTSPTRSHGGIHGDRQSAASEFSDIEDDPRSHCQSGEKGKKTSAVPGKGKNRKGDGLPPMARSSPAAPSSKLGRESSATANPLEDSDRQVRMASSLPTVPTSAQPGNSLPEEVPPLPAVMAGSSGTVATVGAHSAEDGNSTPFATTPLELKDSAWQGPPPARVEPTADGDEAAAANHHFESNSATPEGMRKASKQTDSRDSSNRTGSTEKKMLTADVEGGTTHGSSEGKEANRSGDTSDGVVKAPASPQEAAKGESKKETGSPQRAQDADEVSFRQAAASCGSHGTNSMRYLSPRAAEQQSNHSAERTAELLESMQNGESDDGGHFDEGEILNNISFFDPEKGEFILTNHDIHSLEAFLFGTEALVRYINELQNAILEMQHETELAKRL